MKFSLVIGPGQISAFAILVASIGCLSTASAEDWMQFRGGVAEAGSTDQQWPSDWSKDANLAWTASIDGAGWSSPIVLGNRVYVTSAVSDEVGTPKGFQAGVASMGQRRDRQGPSEPFSFRLTCLQLADGEEVWTKEVAQRTPAAFFHPSNTYATESPTSDGNHIFVYFASVGIVACHDLDGERIWIRDFGSFPTGNDFGTGSSLAVLGNKLFVQNDNERQSSLHCLDTATGEDLWTIERDGRTCWSSPLVWNSDAGVQLVVCGSSDVVGLNVENGETIWRLTGMGGSFSSSPAADARRVYFGNSGPGRRGPLVAVDCTARGELSVSEETDGIAWVKRSAGPGMASPISHDGLVYVVSRNILSCHDAENGEEVYRSRLPGAASVASSLIMDKGRLIILDENGKSFVVKPGREFQLLATNTIDGLFWSTPSATKDALLLREAEKIYCIRSK